MKFRPVHSLLVLVAGAISICAHAESVDHKDDTNVTLQNLVDKLSGSGVTISNPQYSGNNNQSGLFSGYSFLFGADIDEGVIFSTGTSANVVGANAADNTTTQFNAGSTNDPDLGNGIYDPVKFTLDVIPDENTLIVDYVFGSEEYNEYVSGGYNDNIRVLVDGTNCALTADGQIVSIDAINNSTNSFLYNDNDFGDLGPTTPFGTQMDGFTSKISCRFSVTPGASVTLIIGMSDDGDAQYDSWAFFKAHSLRSEDSNEFGDAPDSYQTLVSNNGASHVIVEGVSLGELPDGDTNGFHDGIDDSAGGASDDAYDDGVLTFPNLLDTDTTYSITVQGTSINGFGSDIIAWIDFDRDGSFQIDEASNVASLSAGSYQQNVVLTWNNIGSTGPDITQGPTYARVRIVNSGSGIGAVNYNGNFATGEVEDYLFQISGSGDVTVPVVTINTPQTVTIPNQNVYQVSGNCTAGDNNVTVAITGATPASQSVICNGGGQWSATFNVSAVADGSNTISVTASQQDAQANTGNAGPSTADKDATVPTVDIQNEPPIVNNTSAFNVTIEFSEDVTGLTVGEIIVGNGSASNLVGVDGNTYTVDITPSGAGDITIDVPDNVAQDGVSNNNTAATQATTTFDNVAPAVVTTSAPVANAGNASNYPVSGTCTAGDDNVTVSIAGATPANQSVTCTGGGNWSASFDVSAVGDGTNVITVDASQTDTAGNTGNAATVQANKDADIPGVDIQNEPAIVNSTAAFNVTFEFTENVTGFVVGDIVVGNGGAGNFVAVDGNTYTADITPTGTGTITIDVPATVAQDVSANSNTAATQASILFDNVPPTVDIQNEPVIVNSTVAFNVTIKFSENVSGFVIGDITVGNGSASNFVTVDGNTYTADITPSGAGNITIDVNAAVAQDAAGNNNTAATQATTTFDNVPPSVDIQNEPVIVNSTSVFNVTFEFSENVSGFVIGDITVGNGSASNFVAVDGNTYTADITPSGAGDITIDVNAAVAQDAASNNNTAATQASTTFDNVAPSVATTSAPVANAANATSYAVSGTCTAGDGNITVSITGATPASQNVMCTGGGSWSATFNVSAIGDSTNALTIDASQTDSAGNTGNAVTVQADKDVVAPSVATTSSPVAYAANETSYPVSGTCSSGDGDVTVSITGATPASQAVTCTGGGSWSATFDVSAITDGSNALTIDASQTDSAGNTGNAATAQADKDTGAPSVDIQNEPAIVNSTAAFNVTFEFSEDVTGFVTGDISVGNGSASNFVTVDGNTYTADITPSAGGDITIDVNAAVAQDAAGNDNTAATQATTTFDSTAPTVDIQNEPTSVNSTAAFNVTFEFSENVSGFVIGDISVGNGSASNFVTVDGNTYTADITPSAGGNITIDVNAAVAQDAAGNDNTAATQATTTFDSTAPTVDIQNEPTSVNSTAAFNVTFEFSENVSGFVVGDISVGNGNASNFVTVDGNTYTADITPSVAGDITIDVNAAVAQDAAGNDNTAATQAVVTYDSSAPSVDIQNEPAIVNDTSAFNITIEFSENVTGFVIGDISVGNGSAGNFVTVDGNTYTADITPSAGGDITIDVNAAVAQDGSGNNNTAALQAVVTFDNTAPGVAITSAPAANSSSENNYIVSGSCTAGDGNVTVSIASATPANQSVACSGAGSWSATFDVSAITDGSNALAITASQTDAASNTGNDTAQADKDTVAPATPTVDNITDDTGTSNSDGLTNDDRPVISGTWDEANASALSVTIDSVTYILGTDAELSSDGSGNWSLDLTAPGSPLADNTYDVAVSSSDAAGNSSIDSTNNEFTIDTTVATPTVTSQLTNDTTPVISGSAQASSAVEITVAGATYSTTASGAGTWSLDTEVATPDSGAFNPDVNGANTVFVTNTDTAGNTAGDVTVNELVIDTTAPAVSTDAPATVNSGNETSYTVTGTCTSGDGNVSVTITGAPAVSLNNNPVCGGAGSWSTTFDVSSINNGVNAVTIDATQTDSATNVGNAATVQTDKNTSVPTAPTVDSQITNDITPVITGTAQASMTITINVAGATFTTTSDGSGDWSVDTSNAPDSGTFNPNVNGVNQVVATATDAFSNTSPADSDTDELTIDTTAPAVPTVDALTTSDPTPVITGAAVAAAGEVVTVTVGGASYTVVPDGSNVWTLDLGSATPDSGSLSLNTGGTSGTTNTVVVTTTDQAGNSSTDSTANELIIDVDSDNDGIPDVVDGLVDSDGDGNNNHIDRDSDNDGIPDRIESGISGNDSDDDGIDDTYDVDFTGGSDANGDGVDDNVLPIDTDGDGTTDYLDVDSDNDGTPDFVESNSSGTDSDVDGIDDTFDVDQTGGNDANGDGIDDNAEIDTDNDGIADARDPDSDNDGVPDAIEGGVTNTDTDGDGIDNTYDVDITGGSDVNGDGIDDAVTPPDMDSDGLADILDPDSDNDGISDFIEGGTSGSDTDGDGIDDAYDVDQTGGSDVNGDGVDDAVVPPDSDGDGVQDIFDPDSDGDGIPDAVEGNVDSDNDGIADYLDSDSDNDGTPDSVEAGTSGNDSDGDGIDDTYDVDNTGGVDSNGDGVDDNVIIDTDGDGIANVIDVDTDGDGVPDILENGSSGFDFDGDGIDDAYDVDQTGGVDSNGDGIDDNVTAPDSDNDGVTDYLDKDSDNDGIPDGVEALTTGIDTDGDGIDDAYDTDQTIGSDVNFDGIIDSSNDSDSDGIVDMLDLDSDQDGLPDAYEAGSSGNDSDGDGIDNVFDVDLTGGVDANGDGVDDAAAIDSDNDGLANFQDVDADNDGIPDFIESGVSGNDSDGDGIDDTFDVDFTGGNDSNNNGIDDAARARDTDSDGTPDYLDTDSDHDGIIDSTEADTGSDSDGDGIDDLYDVDQTGGADTNNNGIDDAASATDTDGDTIPDYRDLDSDHDSIPDVVEAGLQDNDLNALLDNGAPTTDTPRDSMDPSGIDDGIPDYRDVDSNGDGIFDIDDAGYSIYNDGSGMVTPPTDSDGDGIADVVDGDPTAFGLSNDTDGDGVSNALDLDDDNDGIPDTAEQNGNSDVDSDGDGIVDRLDRDSDNDGIPDSIEAVTGSVPDTDADGVVDNFTDTNSDGLHDSIVTTMSPVDTDNDGIEDFRDLDSDNDGLFDNFEAAGFSNAFDLNEDGIMDDLTDVDRDGFSDVVDTDVPGGVNGTALSNPDTDGDGDANYRDTDSDNDGYDDLIENGDFDNDGTLDNIQPAGSLETAVRGVGGLGTTTTLAILLILMILRRPLTIKKTCASLQHL